MDIAHLSSNRIFVLDTNVLMHDPTALFRFKEHDVYLPMVVIEELDNSKKGLSETARNVRQASRFLDELISNKIHKEIEAGIPLTSLLHYQRDEKPSGKLFLQTEAIPATIPNALPGNKCDNSIIAAAYTLKQLHHSLTVTLVSKDINLRIKAAMIGIHAEDYFNDRALDDLDLLYSGIFELPSDFWDKYSNNLESWKKSGRTFYRITGSVIKEWRPNHCVFLNDDSGFEAIVKNVDRENNTALLEIATDYRSTNHAVWGVVARNREQNFALNMLMDPNIDLVTLLGAAGTGKTLLTLAAALQQTLEHKQFQEIIMTRVTIPVGEDIGFLPGTEEEKMTPWMGALMDNLEVLTSSEIGGEWGRSATNDLLRHRIKIRSLNFMRGRTFLNKFIIIDEAQNLTAKQMQTLITRAGPGTKIVCLGNLSQIDTPYLTETSSGLTNVVDQFQNWDYSGHITLMRGERSRLADFAASIFDW